MKKAQYPAPVEISQLTSAVLNGELKHFPKVLRLDLENANQADYQALLQLVRYRSFGHRVLRAQPGQSDIQKIRALINAGSFSEALRKTATLDQSDPDVRLEIARAHVFLGQFAPVVPLLTEMSNDPRVATCTRGVAWQLIGHSQMELGDLPVAIRSFEAARDLAVTCGNSVGSISADLFLSRSYAFDGRFPEAWEHLESALEEIMEIGSFRWLLGYYRHGSHLSFLAGEERAIRFGQAGILLSMALKDSLFQYRGMIELSLMAKRFSLQVDLESVQDEISKFARDSESDLQDWLNALAGRAEPATFSAKRFISEAQRTKIPSSAKSSLLDIPKPSHWIFDRNAEIFIDLKSSKVIPLPLNSPPAKLLTILNSELAGLSTAELFQRAWKLRWSPERHQNVLDVNIHRLNKTSESLKLLRKDGTLRLKYRGLLI